MTHHSRLRRTILWCSVALLATSARQAPPRGQAAAVPRTYMDRAAVEFATHEYANAWRANDQKRVMATLLPDAVLLPSGRPPIAGTQAITHFWFPSSGPGTKVTAMELSIDDLRIDGDLAVVSGRGTLTYVTVVDGKSTAPRTLRSWYVNVLRRQPDDKWLIARRAWSDLP